MFLWLSKLQLSGGLQVFFKKLKCRKRKKEKKANNLPEKSTLHSNWPTTSLSCLSLHKKSKQNGKVLSLPSNFTMKLT